MRKQSSATHQKLEGENDAINQGKVNLCNIKQIRKSHVPLNSDQNKANELCSDGNRMNDVWPHKCLNGIPSE